MGKLMLGGGRFYKARWAGIKAECGRDEAGDPSRDVLDDRSWGHPFPRILCDEEPTAIIAVMSIGFGR